jgi:hypothetical protein
MLRLGNNLKALRLIYVRRAISETTPRATVYRGRVHRPAFETTRKHNVSRILSVSVLRWEKEKHNLLGLSEKKT